MVLVGPEDRVVVDFTQVVLVLRVVLDRDTVIRLLAYMSAGVAAVLVE
jgi:hypothetical protein